MSRALIAATAAATLATGAYGGAIERSDESVGILFEEGSYAELSFGIVNPELSGDFMGVLNSGDMANSYISWSLGYKMDINEALSFALILDEPIGANTNYSSSDPGYPFAAGATAVLDSTSVTGILKYRMPSNVSVYGGLRAQTATGAVAIPAAGYSLTADSGTEVGWLAGVAYERPDIALRVSLTYNSEIDHDFDGFENGVLPSSFTSTVPESWHLEFQTGIAEDTLLFGSIKQRSWSDFDITPPGFAAGFGGASLVDYSEDTTSYELGVGRRFSDEWAGAITLYYEPEEGGLYPNLGPRNGYQGIGVGATYTKDSWEISGGVRYLELGDATTTTIGSEFTGGSAMAAGIRIGYNY